MRGLCLSKVKRSVASEREQEEDVNVWFEGGEWKEREYVVSIFKTFFTFHCGVIFEILSQTFFLI